MLVSSCISTAQHCGCWFFPLRDWNDVSLFKLPSRQWSWPSSHSWSSEQVKLEGLVQLAWFNLDSNNRLTWSYCGGGSRFRTKACRRGIQIQFNLETMSVYQTVYPWLSAFWNQYRIWHGCMFHRLLLNKLYHVCLVLDAFMLGRPIIRCYLLMFITWRCAFGFSTTHLILVHVLYCINVSDMDLACFGLFFGSAWIQLWIRQ